MEKYIIKRTILRHKNGARSVINTEKVTYDLEAYRGYLKKALFVDKVNFTYDTVPEA